MKRKVSFILKALATTIFIIGAWGIVIESKIEAIELINVKYILSVIVLSLLMITLLCIFMGANKIFRRSIKAWLWELPVYLLMPLYLYGITIDGLVNMIFIVLGCAAILEIARLVFNKYTKPGVQ